MKNLIKHEFRATARLMVPLFVIAFVSGIVMFLCPNDGETMKTISSIAVTVFVISIFTIGIMCFVIILSRFYRNVMTDNAYLTMTLPINVHEFIFGELIVAMIWILLSVLLLIAIGLVFLSAKQMITIPTLTQIQYGIDAIAKVLNENSVDVGDLILYVVEVIIFLILSFFFFCLRFYFIMAVGQLFSRHRLFACVAIYLALQFMIPVGAYQILRILSFSFTKITTLFGLELIIGILTLCAVVYLPTAFILNKKLNIQ